MSVTVRVHRYREGDYSKPDGVLKTEATTVSEALEKFLEQNEDWRRRLFDESGEVRRFVNIYVDEEDVRFLQKLDTRLKDGSEINIIPVMCGG